MKISVTTDVKSIFAQQMYIWTKWNNFVLQRNFLYAPARTCSAVCVNGAKMRMIHTFCSSLPVFQAVAKLFARVSFTITGSIAKRENVLQKLKEQVMACHTK